jgi:hypothetical protein
MGILVFSSNLCNLMLFGNGFDIYWPDSASILVLIWWAMVIMGVN